MRIIRVSPWGFDAIFVSQLRRSCSVAGRTSGSSAKRGVLWRAVRRVSVSRVRSDNWIALGPRVARIMVRVCNVSGNKAGVRMGV